MPLSGKHEGDFAEIMAVRRLRRAAAGKLAGEKKGGIQVFICNVVLYFAHGMRYLVSEFFPKVYHTGTKKEQKDFFSERLNFFLIRPVEVA